MIDTNPKPWTVIIGCRWLDCSLPLTCGIKYVEGYFEGNREFGLAVTLPSKAELPYVARLAFEFGERSVLVLDPYRAAYLLYADGREEKLGKWHAVPEIIAKAREAYTYDPETGVYYVCD